MAAFAPPQPTFGAAGGLRRVNIVPKADALAALTHPTVFLPVYILILPRPAILLNLLAQ
jgi:hypothetical protein